MIHRRIVSAIARVIISLADWRERRCIARAGAWAHIARWHRLRDLDRWITAASRARGPK